jgi:hypothetical protein
MTLLYRPSLTSLLTSANRVTMGDRPDDDYVNLSPEISTSFTSRKRAPTSSPLLDESQTKKAAIGSHARQVDADSVENRSHQDAESSARTLFDVDSSALTSDEPPESKFGTVVTVALVVLCSLPSLLPFPHPFLQTQSTQVTSKRR